MKLSYKLLIIFLITTSGGITISTITLTSFQDIFKAFENLYDTTSETVILDKIKTLSTQFEIATLRYQIDFRTSDQNLNTIQKLEKIDKELDYQISLLIQLEHEEFIEKLKNTKKALSKSSISFIKVLNKNNEPHQGLKDKLRGLENKMLKLVEEHISLEYGKQQSQQKEVKNLFSITIYIIVVISVVIISMAVSLSIIASRNITKPLILLRNLTSEIVKGNYIPIKIQGENEIKDLTNNFNSMQESLKKQNQQKEELASMITHELTTPIVPIITSCKNLEETNLDDFQIKQVSRIRESSTELQEMVNGILDAQKLNMDTMKFINKEFVVSDFLENIKESFVEITQKKNIQLKITPNEKIIINSDSKRIFQVIGNLIKNSIDFVSDGTGEITIGYKTINNEIIFYVKDNGIGISEEDQKKIFKEKFYQIDTSLEREHGGTGLGLVICKGIVEKLGGRIWVESKLNQGTSVFFTISKS